MQIYISYDKQCLQRVATSASPINIRILPKNKAQFAMRVNDPNQARSKDVTFVRPSVRPPVQVRHCELPCAETRVCFFSAGNWMDNCFLEERTGILDKILVELVDKRGKKRKKTKTLAINMQSST